MKLKLYNSVQSYTRSELLKWKDDEEFLSAWIKKFGGTREKLQKSMENMIGRLEGYPCMLLSELLCLPTSKLKTILNDPLLIKDWSLDLMIPVREVHRKVKERIVYREKKARTKLTKEYNELSKKLVKIQLKLEELDA